MAVVTISRQFGAGGITLAQKLCERFGFRLVDEFVIDELARKAKVSPDWLSAIEKEASSAFLGLLSNIVSSGIFYRSPSSPGQDVERKKYISILTSIMTTMADEGGYVLVGRGSQFVLKKHPKAFHVMLAGEYEDRVRFFMEHYSLARPEAEELIKEKEKQRTAIASKVFQADINDVNLYHVALNTSRLPFDWVVDSVSDMLTRFMKHLAC
jgi:CMP/dCMP kinase